MVSVVSAVSAVSVISVVSVVFSPNLSSEWCSSGADMKKQISCQECASHDLQSEGVEYNTRQKSRRWAVLGVLLIVGTFC